MWLTCCAEIGTALETEQLFLLSCSHSEKQEHRFPLKKEEGLFAEAFAFCLWLLLWALAFVWVLGGFGFGLGTCGFCLLLLAFYCGKLLEGKRITEGKRIAKVKLLKGKEWLKRG
jgi:uncharacterized RDD family membrane protein YckC